MKATLITRCGCERTMEIPYPPTARIVVPLRSDRLSVWFDELEPPSAPMFTTRTFELYRESPPGPYGRAEYLEKP